MADGLKNLVAGMPQFVGQISDTFNIQNTGYDYVRMLANKSTTPPSPADFNAGYKLYSGPEGSFTGRLAELFFDDSTHLHLYAPTGGSVVIYGTSA